MFSTCMYFAFVCSTCVEKACAYKKAFTVLLSLFKLSNNSWLILLTYTQIDQLLSRCAYKHRSYKNIDNYMKINYNQLKTIF